MWMQDQQYRVQLCSYHVQPQHRLSCCPVAVLLLSCRVLKEGGVLINITYGEPSARVPFLQRLHFDVAFYMLTKAQELAAGAGVQGAPVGSNGGITVHGPVDAHTQVSGGSGSSCDWSVLVTGDCAVASLWYV